uniref:Uncharacterized protein n=1 Tax=Rhodopseudomonas palustris (strain BisA53) TaxID=316055 RepID=Q07N68_RHOP5
MRSVARVMDQPPDGFGLPHRLAMGVVRSLPIAGVLFDQKVDQRPATRVVIGAGEQVTVAVDVKAAFRRTHVAAPGGEGVQAYRPPPAKKRVASLDWLIVPITIC